MEVCCVVGHGTVADELYVDGLRVTCVHHRAGVIHAHAHDTAKLVVLLDGGATERIGLDLVTHRPYEAVARRRFVAHENQYHARGSCSIVVELDTAARLDGQLDAQVARALGSRLAAAFGDATSDRRRADRQVANNRERGRAVRAVVADMLVALSRPRRARPSWLDAAREQLFTRLDDPPSIDALARGLGVHPIHLAQAFRRQFATTPMGFVRAHRVFRAVELIARGGPLAQVAADVGFADQSHMSRTIALARSAPPGELRRIMRPNPVQDRAS